MHLRKQMVLRVSQGELSVSGAAREYGVSRNTVRLWVERAAQGSVSGLSELSRRPHRIARCTDQELQERLLELKSQRPAWGAKKLVAKLWPDEKPPMSVRTADRILARHGLVGQRSKSKEEIRFERAEPNELLQMDFKGLGRPNPGYYPLSVVDDASRFCLAFRPLPNHQVDTIFDTLWEIFGEYGLPDAILTDNEPCFAGAYNRGPSRLQAKLWLLGIRLLHGRIAHPQTQGKVERFHLTVEQEIGSELLWASLEEARGVYDRFVQDYNYERPHEALDMRAPGLVYKPSTKKRPEKMPTHEPSTSLVRKVQATGAFRFNGNEYRPGRGLSGELVELREEPDGYGVYYANRRFALLDDIKVSKMC